MRASICVRSYHHFHISRLQIVIMDIHSPVLLCGGLLLKVAITAFLIAWSSLWSAAQHVSSVILLWQNTFTMQSYATVLLALCAHFHWLCEKWSISWDWAKTLQKEQWSSCGPWFTFQHLVMQPDIHVRPLETHPSEGFIDLNECDNKQWMLRVSNIFQVHVMTRGAKVKCFEQGQMTHHGKRSQVKS